MLIFAPMTQSSIYTISDIAELIRDGRSVSLSVTEKRRVQECAEYLQKFLKEDAEPVYGVNTGFGSLCNISIPKDKISDLQSNLLRSHACGVGDLVPEELIKWILNLKVISLKQGYSGVSLDTIQRLIEFSTEGPLPVLYELGSLGASGDLAPLAHMALPLIGEGQVWDDGEMKPAAEVVGPGHKLGPKEGLALINGTQFSTAYAAWSIHEGWRLMDWAIRICALSMDVFGCRRTPLDERIHHIRNQSGQKVVAGRLRDLLEGSELEKISGSSVQDPYSFRCAPQVLGATYDALEYAQTIVEREINAVTDNPNVFYEEESILEGGNFHAQPIALICDHLANALAELASIAERRIFLLVSGYRDLPTYLTQNPGVESGMMIVQYTAASVVSQNKQLCTPASIDSIVSSKGQEDHVSMAANAATRLRRIVLNVKRVLAMELLVAAQALEFRRPMNLSKALESLLESYREKVSFADRDRIFSNDIQRSIDFLKTRI